MRYMVAKMTLLHLSFPLIGSLAGWAGARRRAGLSWLVLPVLLASFGAFLCPASTGAQGTQEAYDRLLMEGVSRIHQGDLDGAMPFFEKAVSEKGDGAEAPYYQGVIHLQQGRLAEAEKRFKEALALDRALVPARFDLGVARYRMGKDKEAMEAFRAVAAVDPDRARVYHYQGLIQKRAGRDAEAERLFERAALLDAELVVPRPTETRRPGDFFDQIDLHYRRKKPWEIRLSVGAQHDDAIPFLIGQGPPTLASEEKGWAGVFALRGRYQWLDTEKWVGRGRYRFHQSTYRKDGDLDTQDHLLVLDAGSRVGTHEWTLQYEFQTTRLGGDPYLVRHMGGPRWVFSAARDHLTEIVYQFGMRRFDDHPIRFPNNSDRDATLHRVGGTHYRFLPQRWSMQGYVYGGLFYNQDRAGSDPTEDDWSHKGPVGVAGIALPVGNKTLLGVDVRYARQKFGEENTQAPNIERLDMDWGASALLSKAFGPGLDVAVQYAYQHTKSNIALFEEDHRVYAITMDFKY